MGMIRKGVETRVKKKLIPFFKKEGFTEHLESFSFTQEYFPNTIFKISFNIKGYSPDDFSIQCLCMLKMKQVEDLWFKYHIELDNRSRPYPHTISCILEEIIPELDTGYHKVFGEARIPIRNENDILEFSMKFKNNYYPQIVSYFTQMSSLDHLDALANKNPLHFKEISPPFNIDGLEFRKIILAHLTRNPKLEEIYLLIREDTHLLSKDDPYMHKILLILDKVYLDLKNIH